jgi:hypothetical protein
MLQDGQILKQASRSSSPRQELHDRRLNKGL